ncbi:MAG: 30S ribosomal protein S17e [Nanoarchaeota archaeon]|nr:30S ribosomal protein S17e [Nanoarchaeota archaeon]
MGRISTKLIKKKSREFIKYKEDAFCKDFEKNKQSLKEMTSFGSKKIRNRIAGQITKRMKKPER